MKHICHIQQRYLFQHRTRQTTHLFTDGDLSNHVVLARAKVDAKPLDEVEISEEEKIDASTFNFVVKKS